MINVFILQGVVRDIQKISTNDSKLVSIKLRVKKSNESKRDTFEILITDNLANLFDVLIHNGDKISVHGHMEEKNGKIKLIADKVSFNN